MSEAYGAADRRLFERLSRIGKAPKVVYDIGASSGSWTRAVGPIVPCAEFHLFEPLAANARYRPDLERYTAAHPNWHLHEIALGKESGPVEIRINKTVVGSTMLPVGHAPSFFPDSSEATCWRLDDYRSAEGLPIPDLVKMDTQGSELLIIAGGRESIAAAQILLVESWLYRGYGPATPLLGDIVDIARSLGFYLYEFGDFFRNSEGRLQSVDAMFLKPELATAMCQNAGSGVFPAASQA